MNEADTKRPMEQGAQLDAAAPATLEPKKAKEWHYWIDWLRSIDVHCVVTLHCVFTVDKVTGYSLENHLWKEKMDSYFRYLVQQGIPVFFLLSGMASIGFRTEDKGFAGYAIGKAQRLFTPLVLSVFVFLLPRLYMGQSWDPTGRLNKGQDIEWDFFQYCGKVLSDNIVMKLGQLWFLPVLLIITLVNYPLLAWSRRRKFNKPLDKQDGLIYLGLMVTCGFLAGFFYVLMKNKSDWWNYVMPANIILFACFSAFFAFQYYLQGLPAHDFSHAQWLRLIGPITSICLNFFKYGTEEKNFYSISMMICYHTVFFAQGVVNATWMHKLQQHSDYLRATVLYPFFIIGIVMMYGVCMPGFYTEVGFLFFYPIYGNTYVQSLFTTGSWICTYGLAWVSKKELNQQFNKEIFKFFTGGSLFVYLCHDLWITVIASYIIYPNLSKNSENGEGISFAQSLAIMLIGTELLSNLNYYLLVKAFSLCGKKKRPQKPQDDIQAEQPTKGKITTGIQDEVDVEQEGGGKETYQPNLQNESVWE